MGSRTFENSIHLLYLEIQLLLEMKRIIQLVYEPKNLFEIEKTLPILKPNYKMANKVVHQKEKIP